MKLSEKILPDFKDTSSVDVPSGLMDQIIGQDHAVEIVRLAALQRRLLLIAGEPGTGKSLLGQAVAEIMTADHLVDVLAYENSENRNLPVIRIVPAGGASAILEKERERSKFSLLSELYLINFSSAALIACGLFYFIRDSDYMWIAGSAFSVYLLWKLRKWLLGRVKNQVPKILAGHSDSSSAPFVDATGSQEGALLGDVRHDPFQSGGMETPPHMLLEAGAVHRAHGGVLYIDELSMLSHESQQSLLTAIQTKVMPVTGRSPGSSGTMIRSFPIPCDFLLILAGNMEDIEKLHPALRSRIKGYGYEVYTKTSMPVNEENTARMIQFIAQEINRDGKIPHFSYEAVNEILAQAVLRSDNPDSYTLRLRELGGLIRISGDIAVKEGQSPVSAWHVRSALKYARSIEEQKDEERYIRE